MKRVVIYHGGEFDSAFPENTALVLKTSKVTLNDEKKSEIEVADLLVFDENGGQHIKRSVPHEDDKIDAKNGKGEKCHHAYYEEE